MLGIGREEILECEERYGQRRKGKKSSLAQEKRWTRSYFLGWASSDDTVVGRIAVMHARK